MFVKSKGKKRGRGVRCSSEVLSGVLLGGCERAKFVRVGR